MHLRTKPKMKNQTIKPKIMNKKALVSRTIVLMTLGIIVLIILIILFSGKANIFSKGVGGSCADQEGTCYYPSAKCHDDKPMKIMAKGCPLNETDTEKKSGFCCISLG